MQRPLCVRRTFQFEPLEPRLVLSTVPGLPAPGVEYQPYIIAGDPNASPADSPALRVDANTTTSDFAGVGSLFMSKSGVTGYICTGTPIDPTHVLTAAHCLDTNNNGTSDFKAKDVTFFLNYGGNLTSQIGAANLTINPNFTGFNSPSVNDDLAIIELKQALPAGVPTYDLYTGPLTTGSTMFTMVGYGRSGDGVNGYTENAGFTIKRTGANVVDMVELDDEGGPAAEVFVFDFDGPTGNGPLGGASVGNQLETNLGGGDSGGPSFVDVGGGTYQLAGVNTFGMQGGGFGTLPYFGSGGGGILIGSYVDWINSVLDTGGAGAGGGGGGGGGGNGHQPGGGRPFLGDNDGAVLVMPPLTDTVSSSVESPSPEQPAPPESPTQVPAGAADEALVALAAEGFGTQSWLNDVDHPTDAHEHDPAGWTSLDGAWFDLLDAEFVG